MECRECGSEFTPKRKTQIYCCRACQTRRKSREQYKRRGGYQSQAKHSRQFSKAKCLICGEIIYRRNGPGIPKQRMHDECLRNDILDTLRSGKTVNSCQWQRMSSYGYTLKDFKEIIYKEIEAQQKKKDIMPVTWVAEDLDVKQSYIRDLIYKDKIRIYNE